MLKAILVDRIAGVDREILPAPAQPLDLALGEECGSREPEPLVPNGHLDHVRLRKRLGLGRSQPRGRVIHRPPGQQFKGVLDR